MENVWLHSYDRYKRGFFIQIRGEYWTFCNRLHSNVKLSFFPFQVTCAKLSHLGWVFMETTSTDALYNITRDGRKMKKRSVVLPKF